MSESLSQVIELQFEVVLLDVVIEAADVVAFRHVCGGILEAGVGVEHVEAENAFQFG